MWTLQFKLLISNSNKKQITTVQLEKEKMWTKSKLPGCASLSRPFWLWEAMEKASSFRLKGAKPFIIHTLGLNLASLLPLETVGYNQGTGSLWASSFPLCRGVEFITPHYSEWQMWVQRREKQAGFNYANLWLCFNKALQWNCHNCQVWKIRWVSFSLLVPYLGRKKKYGRAGSSFETLQKHIRFLSCLALPDNICSSNWCWSPSGPRRVPREMRKPEFQDWCLLTRW